MLKYSEASKIIFEELSTLNLTTNEVDILDSINCVLAEDVFADISLPPFTNSAMDGFAVKYNSSVKEWNLIGEISAGNYNQYVLDEHSAVHIMTGSKLPPNATAIIPVENVKLDVDKVILNENISVRENQNIRRLGEDLQKGMLALEKNQTIRSNNISLLAACGKSKIKVYEKLKIGVLAAGDELVNIDVVPDGDKIRATNLYTILSAVKEINMEPINLGLINDDKEKLRQKLSYALQSGLDILLTTGGVSVGKYDYMKELMAELGVELKFWKVNIKPGKPLAFGIYQKGRKKIFWFGLPGNPVSSYVNFVLFVRSNIESIYKTKKNNIIIAELLSSINKKDGKRHFVRGKFYYDVNRKKHLVNQTGSHSSGNMAGLSLANCLIVIEEERKNPQAGELVECIMI